MVKWCSKAEVLNSWQTGNRKKKEGSEREERESLRTRYILQTFKIMPLMTSKPYLLLVS
jgi:hypothetical protein